MSDVKLQCTVLLPPHTCKHDPSVCCLAATLHKHNDTLTRLNTPSTQNNTLRIPKVGMDRTTKSVERHWIPGEHWCVKYHTAGYTILNKDTNRQLYSLWKENNEICCSSKINRTGQTCHNPAVKKKDRNNGWSLHCSQHHRHNKKKGDMAYEPLNIHSFLESQNYPLHFNRLDIMMTSHNSSITQSTRSEPASPIHTEVNTALHANSEMLQPTDYMTVCPGAVRKSTQSYLVQKSTSAVSCSSDVNSMTTIHVCFVCTEKLTFLPKLRLVVGNLNVINAMVPPYGYTFRDFLYISGQVRDNLSSQRNDLLLHQTVWTDSDRECVQRVWNSVESTHMKKVTGNDPITDDENAIWMRYTGTHNKFPLICNIALYIPPGSVDNPTRTSCFIPSGLVLLWNIVEIRRVLGYLYEIQLINILTGNNSTTQKHSLLQLIHTWIANNYDMCLLTTDEIKYSDMQMAFNDADPLGFKTVHFFTSIMTLPQAQYPWRRWTTTQQKENPDLFKWLSKNQTSLITMWETAPYLQKVTD
jgi:hypothetical protein